MPVIGLSGMTGIGQTLACIAATPYAVNFACLGHCTHLAVHGTFLNCFIQPVPLEGKAPSFQLLTFISITIRPSSFSWVSTIFTRAQPHNVSKLDTKAKVPTRGA